MFKTKITEMLGIEYPIIGGAMMWISTPEFVSAISNAGGMGILASTIYQTSDDFANALDNIKKLTNKPFAVNLSLFKSIRPIDNNLYLDVMMEKGINIVETSGHSAPVDLCKRFKEAGMIWIHKCVGSRYAAKVQSLGADIVTVVGYENGGATGKLDIATLVLVPVVKDVVNIPVIGGGGVSDGRGLAAILALGADGIIMGTRLLTTKECPIHDTLKMKLLDATEIDTRLIMRTVNATHRVLSNEAAQKCLELEDRGADFPEILKIVSGIRAKGMFDSGDSDAGIVACGQGVGMANDIPTVKTLFDRMIAQAKDIVRGLGK